ncbi:hypothetical protein BDZ89DRAFT_1209637 [Hymenopellis radicata]|nr:hypothetical protein BDZ89DRAFT_1209637 [Hymenopellis radicata]
MKETVKRVDDELGDDWTETDDGELGAHARLVANLEEKMEKLAGVRIKRICRGSDRFWWRWGEHAAEWAWKKGTYVFFEGPGGIISGEDGSAAEDVTGGPSCGQLASLKWRMAAALSGVVPRH